MSVEPSTTEASLDSVADDPLNGGPIPLNETTVTAFVGRTQRGPVNRAVPVRSYDEYRRVFGSHTPFSFLSYAVLHYFICLLYTSPSPRDVEESRMPSSA